MSVVEKQVPASAELNAIATGDSHNMRRWLVAGILFLTVIAGFFDRISIAVLFTNTDFQNAMGTGFDPTRLGLLMTSFLIAYGLSNVLLSALVDLFGPSRTLNVSVVIWGALMLIMGSSGSFTMMMTLRALLGLAEGPQFSICNAVIARWFPPHQRARANSMWTIGSPLGSAIGFPVTTWLVAAHGWRDSFFALAILNLVIILPLTLFFVRDKAPGMPVVVSQPGKPQLSYREGVKLFVTDWHYWLVVLASCGTLIYLWGLNSWLPSYLIKQRHLAPEQAGIYAALPFILVVVGQIGGSYLSDRLGKRAVVAGFGLILSGVFMYFVSFMPSPQTATLMIGLSGMFWGAVTPVSYALIMDIVPQGAVATAVGFKNGISNLVGALAPVAMGMVVASTGSFDTAFLVLVGATLIGGVLMIPLMRAH